MIKAILFDLDETLLDRDATVELYLKSQHARFGLNHIPYQVYRDRFMELDAHGYADKQDVFQTLVSEFALPVTADHLVADFRQNAWKSCVTYPDADRVLRQLRSQGYRLGIITNGSVESQRAKFLASGLSALVDMVLISEEEKVRKPDLEIFVRAADRLGVTSAECIFVGDNPQTDIGGAQRAGMKTVWIKRHLPWPEELAVVPDRVVSNLAALLIVGF